jgi:hypothetical protein
MPGRRIAAQDFAALPAGIGGSAGAGAGDRGGVAGDQPGPALSSQALDLTPRDLVNIAFSMDKQQLEGDALMRRYQELGEGLSRQPGVKSVSFSSSCRFPIEAGTGEYAAPGGSPS